GEEMSAHGPWMRGRAALDALSGFEMRQHLDRGAAKVVRVREAAVPVGWERCQRFGAMRRSVEPAREARGVGRGVVVDAEERFGAQRERPGIVEALRRTGLRQAQAAVCVRALSLSKGGTR